jgi:multiple sugar transport system substrate-binding protein
MTLATGAADPDLAWAFLRHLASPEMDKLTSLCGGNGTRLSTWRDPEVLAMFPHYAVLEDAHRGARTLPPVAEYPAIAHALSEMTRRVLHDDDDVGAALATAVGAVDRILAG